MENTTFQLSQKELISALKRNKTEVFKDFYISNYLKTERFILDNNGTIKQAKTIFQDAFIDLWTHVKNDTITIPQSHNLERYLHNTVERKWSLLVASKPEKRPVVGLSSENIIAVKPENNSATNHENKTKLSYTMAAVKSMGKPCKTLLSDFYFYKKSTKEIALKLNIEENAVLSKKYHCLAKLRAIVVASKDN